MSNFYFLFNAFLYFTIFLAASRNYLIAKGRNKDAISILEGEKHVAAEK